MSKLSEFISNNLETNNNNSLFELKNDIHSGAVFSKCKLYRYKLWRIWDVNKPLVLFVMLNPSTADEMVNDPTITRCISFSKDWGFGGVFIGNIFSYRSPHPNDLLKCENPIGDDNDDHILEMYNICDDVVFAWGNHGSLFDRFNDVLSLFDNPKCLGTTSSGQPKHPLYLPKTTELIIYKNKKENNE